MKSDFQRGWLWYSSLCGRCKW